MCNNAGIGQAMRPVWELPLDYWHGFFSIDFWGVVHGIRAFVPLMLKQNDDCHIVNTASLAGVHAAQDPLGRLVYAAPLSAWTSGRIELGRRLRNNEQNPAWADEWSALTGLALGLGMLPNYRVAVDLLNFLREHSIPLCTGAIDVPQWVLQNVPGWSLTSYKDYSDTSTTEGSGTLVYHDFVDNYSRLTMSDGQ